jgi:Flp pilus assembly protein CpaB
MAAPARPVRTRSSGGRTLILLGVLLALAAGAIVIFVVTTYTSTQQQTETVVVAAINLPAGSVLSTTQSGQVGTSAGTFELISAAFTTKTVNTDFAPKDAYVFKNQTDLNNYLNNMVVQGTFLAGDILRTSDQRLTPLSAGAPGSLTSQNPGQIQTGEVLAQIKVDGKVPVVPGDHIDMIVTYCNASLPNVSSSSTPCASQTTLQNIYVYAVQNNVVYVVVTRQNAVTLLYLTTNASNYELAIRKPGDSSTTPTTPVSSSRIISQFFR